MTQLAKGFMIVALVGSAMACGPPPSPLPGEGASRPAEPAHSAAMLDGEVLGVDHVPPADHLASGVRLRLRPGARDAVVVDLAPDWYLDRQGLHFGPSERVRVEGVRRADSPVVYATRVTKNGKTIELRDPKSGEPRWRQRAEP